MNPSGRWLLLVVLSLGAAWACAVNQFGWGGEMYHLRQVHAGVALYLKETGRLPPQLEDVCGAEPHWCLLDSPADWPADRWGNPIRYVPHGDASYELTSAGADGRFGTGDDLRFDSSEDLRMARSMAGCYLLSPAIPRLDTDTLRLTDTVVVNGGYGIGAPVALDSDTAFIAQWYPTAADQLVLLWIRGQGLALTARMRDGSLVSRAGGHVVTGRRIDCIRQ